MIEKVFIFVASEAYPNEENHGSSYSYNIPESNSYGVYDTKSETYGPPKIIESYGPPRPSVYFQEPQSVYGTPEYNGKRKTIGLNGVTFIHRT